MELSKSYWPIQAAHISKIKMKDHRTIPKGEPEPNEDLLITAQREFEEETGLKPTGPFIPLNPIKQKGGKIVHVWAFKGDCNPNAIKNYLHNRVAAPLGSANGDP